MKSVWITGVIAVCVVAAVVGGMLFATRKNKVELSGQVLKIRTQPLDPANSLAVLDVRVTNPSNQQFMVKDVAVKLTDSDGKVSDGEVLSASETDRIFDYFKVLGPRYNPTLLIRNRIHSGEKLDRTVAVKFPVPDTAIERRKSIRIEVTDADGAITGIVSGR